MAIRLLIVDDHALFRQGLKRILALDSGFTVVGEAASGDDAVQLTRTLQPDIVLMDVSMPNTNGVEAAQKLKRIVPATAIILLTMHENNFLQQEAVKIGVSGYILKRSSDRELFDAIKKVHSGSTYFLPLSGKDNSTSIAPYVYKDLTVREKDILRMLAKGMVNREISGQLCISINTVETHRKNIMKKLNLHNLSEIIKYALIHGLIQQ